MAVTAPPFWSRVKLPFTLLSPKDDTTPPVKGMPLPLPEMRRPAFLVVAAAARMPSEFEWKTEVSTSTVFEPAAVFRPAVELNVKYVLAICTMEAVDDR